jgi:DNA-binding transcriptional LysR family regulator
MEWPLVARSGRRRPIARDSSLIAVRVGEVRRVLCASPAYLQTHGKPKSPADLSAHHCITYPSMQLPGLWRVKRDQTEYSVPVRSRLIVTNLESACDAARSGIGIAVALSYHVADSIKSGELIPLLQDFQPPSMPVSIVYSANRSCRSNCGPFWTSPYRA